MRTLKIWITLISYTLITLTAYAQDYSAYTIPDNLENDAVAVVRNYTIQFSQSDKNNGTLKVSKVITILNQQGDQFSNFIEFGDKFHEFKGFSGIIRDASGKVIKKIKKGDLITSSLTDSYTLADDSYRVYYEAKSPSYPYTVEYEYDKRYKNGILSYPPFDPYDGYRVAVEKSSMTIELPLDTDLLYKANYECNLKDEKSNNKHIYTVSLDNALPYSSEVFSPYILDIIPFIQFVPTDFCYDSFCGNLQNWQSFGLWEANLLKDRDIIPDEMKNKIVEMTKDIQDEREKVKILYEYLQNNFRYVSVQLGIGGLQPIEASSVVKNKFGDCKGLSNLMKAMLKSINIPSNYASIRMGGKRDLYKDFASVNQMNHVILMVPLKNDSIWLECTSQTLPFGYIHNDIAGHDALVIDESGKGGIICQLPTYKDTDNKSDIKLTIDVNDSGSAQIKAQFTENLFKYDRYSKTFRSNDRDDHVAYINNSLSLPTTKIGSINTREDKSAKPACMLICDISVEDFANKTGSRLFIPLCPLKKGSLNVFTPSQRVYNIEINQGIAENDTIIFNIPATYALESLPKEIEMETPYGSFKASATQNGNQIIYTQHTVISTGRYDREKYEEIKTFFAQITSGVRRKLVLKKI